jgi:hypothetical protein
MGVDACAAADDAAAAGLLLGTEWPAVATAAARSPVSRSTATVARPVRPVAFGAHTPPPKVPASTPAGRL